MAGQILARILVATALVGVAIACSGNAEPTPTPSAETFVVGQATGLVQAWLEGRESCSDWAKFTDWKESYEGGGVWLVSSGRGELSWRVHEYTADVEPNQYVKRSCS